MDDGGLPGRLLIIGGAEDKCRGTGVLGRFADMCGGAAARIVVITTATGAPDLAVAEYQQAFGKLGVRQVTGLPVGARSDADAASALAAVDAATGVFFSGGDQSRLLTLVGSGLNELLLARLAGGLVVAGTSAGATALGRTMILGGAGPGYADGAGSGYAVRTAPGLGLIPGLVIDMHFGERGRLPRLLSAVTLDPGRLGVGIDEDTAICASGNAFEVIGSGAVSVVDARRATVAPAASDTGPVTLFGAALHLLPAGCVFDMASRSPAIGPAHARY